MILGQIAWVDCFAFLIFLAPQLLVQIGFLRTLITGIKALPYLVLRMPAQLVHERYFTPHSHKSPFVQQCTLFQDVVIRCVRYAFAEIPADIGRVFLSKEVALPFFRFRMFRNGLFTCPIYWREVNRAQSPDGASGLKGVYMIHDETRRPDIVVFYCHGGGFSMGSSYFYMEFLMAWLDILKQSGYDNPALFALEYTLVPETTYPTQIQQALAGYKYVLSLVDSSKIIVSGDSAGGTIILSMLLCLSDYSSLKNKMPGAAVLISPWTTIVSPKNKNTASDYLDADSLHLYGTQYMGTKASVSDAMVSPGNNSNLSWWRRASPKHGWLFIYGAEEVFAPEIVDMMKLLKKAGTDVHHHEEPGWIHAWPVVKLFLSNSLEDRQSGLRDIVLFIRERIDPGTSNEQAGSIDVMCV